MVVEKKRPAKVLARYTMTETERERMQASCTHVPRGGTRCPFCQLDGLPLDTVIPGVLG